MHHVLHFAPHITVCQLTLQTNTKENLQKIYIICGIRRIRHVVNDFVNNLHTDKDICVIF